MMTTTRATVGFIAAFLPLLLVAGSAQDQRTLAEEDNCPCSCLCSYEYSYSFDEVDEPSPPLPPPAPTSQPAYAPTLAPVLAGYAPTIVTDEPSPAPQLVPCVCGADAEPLDTDAPVCDAFYQTDERGLVIIEMETVPIVKNWIFDSSIEGFSGDGYYEYVGENKFREPGTSEFLIPIKFTVTGTFQIEWHSFIVEQDKNTENNDQFMKFLGAQIYGYKELEGGNESFVYPICDDLDPEIYPAAEGFTGDCYMKIYRNGNKKKWAWLTKTSDFDAHDVFVDIEEEGTYTLVMSARSQGHAVDKIILHQTNGLQAAKQTNADETICTKPERETSSNFTAGG